MSKTNLYFSTVQPMPDDTVVVGGHLVAEGSSPTATLIVHFDEEKWRLLAKIPDVVNAITLGRCAGSEPLVAVLAREGFFAEISVANKQLVMESIVPVQTPGFLEDIVLWKGAYYACGAHRQVHRLDGRAWTRVDQGIFKHAAFPKDFLLSMHGVEQLYACGGSGFAACLEGSNWSPLSSPTNCDLNAVLQCSDGRVLFAGGGGLLFSVTPDGKWREIAEGLYPDSTFWDLEEFQGSIYLAAGRDVFKLEGDVLEPVQLPFDRDIEVYSLAASSKSLWLVGDEYVYRLFEDNWVDYLSPSNK